MAARKKRAKKDPPKSKAGRKKEIKRFELALYSADNTESWEPERNEMGFIIRTSGGTPLNATDQGKLFRLLQHEMRALGHKLKRKGQDLDPEGAELPADANPESEAADPDSGELGGHPHDDNPADLQDEELDAADKGLPDPDDSDDAADINR